MSMSMRVCAVGQQQRPVLLASCRGVCCWPAAEAHEAKRPECKEPHYKDTQ